MRALVSLVFLLLGGGTAATAATAATATLNSLVRDVERVEAVREVKDLTATFAQLAQFGRWADMAALFVDNGTLLWGSASATGPAAIEAWLRADAGNMDGVRPGSLDTLVAATPLINLAADGLSARGRFNGWRFQGDGTGATRIQGGIYENVYGLVDGRWKISLLQYYPLYAGGYAGGWRNAGGGNLSVVPFHYTPDEAGVPIPAAAEDAPDTAVAAETLAHRISLLNDEDEVRNLQHAYGYYVDRRMWTDVVDLFAANSTVRIDGVGAFAGAAGVRQALETWMGAEGLTQGVLNEHLMFDTVVRVDAAPGADGARRAVARGVEIGLLADGNGNGNGNATAGWWRFGAFGNRFVKEDGIWKLQELNVWPLVVANYSTGWGHGSTLPRSGGRPNGSELFPGYAPRSSVGLGADGSSADLADLQRRLGRAAAYDGSENVSNAYGFYIDFIDGVGCANMAAVHARDGNKESPFAGFYQTRDRVLKACTQYYGTTARETRAGISFHWRPQPVIVVSQDGRSASVRARLLQPSTERNTSGVLRGAIYHDQTALEDGVWRLWSVTIDEFYWTSSTWAAGWAGVKPRARNASNPAPRDLLAQYPPDLALADMGDPRETGFQGGSGRFVAWPEIQRMWFAYRNPVSGRVPDAYWPGCVPCHHRPAWNLTRAGFQEPPTGPTLVSASSVPASGTLAVTVAAGPDEPVAGAVRLEGVDGVQAQQLLTEKTGAAHATFALPASLPSGTHRVTVRYLGSDRLRPGQATLIVTV